MQKSLWAQNVACNSVVQLVDSGTILSSGRINIKGTDSSIALSFPLSIPAFRDATDGTSFANYIYDATVLMDAAGDTYDVISRDSSVVWSGPVSNNAGLGNLKLNSIYLYKDSTVSLTSAFYAVPR